jgi:hypothetical protein
MVSVHTYFACFPWLVVFSIIINTFAELRSEQLEKRKDMQTYCLICNGSGFDHEGGLLAHTRSIHNVSAVLLLGLLLLLE